MTRHRDAVKASGVRRLGGRGLSELRRRLAWRPGGSARLLPGGIRERLFLLIVLAAVPVLVLQGWIYYQRHVLRRDQALQTEVEVAQGVAMTFSVYLDGVHRQLDAIGQAILAFSQYADVKVQRLLNDAVARHPSVRSMNWVSPEGRILVSNLAGGVGRDLSIRPYFQQIQAGRSWAIGDMTPQGAILDTPTVAMGAAVRDDEGRLLGVVVASIEPTRLGELTFPHQRRAGGVYTIIDSQGQLIYRSPPVPLTWEDRVRWQRADPLLQRALEGQTTRGVIVSPVAKRPVIAARVPIPGTGWVAGAARSMDIAMGPVRRALFQDALLGLLVASLALLLASLVARTIAEPLRRLEHDAQAMGAGVIETPERIQAPTEVRSLRDSVSTMAAGLIDRAEALRESEERYRTLFTNISEGFALGEAVFHQDSTACDFHFLEINDAFEQQTGLTREILGRPMTEVLPNLEQHWIDTYCGVARTGESIRFVNHNKDTGRHYDVFCYSPTQNRFAILFRDVTERVRSEQALRQANERLQEQTEELQVQAEELQAQAEELRAINEALERREREYRTLAENTPEVIARFDRQFRYTYINEYGAKVYGISQRAVIGKRNADLGMPADRVAFCRERFEQVLATGRQQTVDFEFDSPTFGHQYFSSIFVPEFDARGEIVSILAITRDVTEARRAQEAVRSAALFPEENPSPVLRVARDGTLLYANACSGPLLESWDCRVGRPVPNEIRGQVERALDAGEATEAEIACGEVVYSFSIAPIASEDYVNLYGRDITERKRAEQTLREEKALFESMIESLPGTFYLFDSRGRWLKWNKNLEQVSGYTPEEIARMHPLGFFAGEDRQRIARKIQEVFTKGSSSIEAELVSGDGRRIPYFFTGSMTTIGGVDCLIGMGMDISERRQAEEALRQSESFYRQTLESIPGMVFTTRPDGYCDYQSQQWEDYTGVPMAEHLGSGWNKLLHPEDRPRAFAAWRAAVEGNAAYDLEYRVRRHDGRYEWFKVIGRPIRDAAGQIVRWFGVAINIEALKQAEEGLRKLTETLESKVARRTEELEYRARQLQKLTLELSQTEDRERRRLADILHDDLQQQLAAVKFHLGLLGNRTRSDIMIQRTVAQVDQMLADAVETSRSLSHELSPATLYQGNLGDTFEWLANQIRTKHGLDVQVCADGEVSSSSDALKAFLYKAAQELLFNVVKHARVGEARIRVRRTGSYVCLVVSDRGRGFDPQDLKAAPGFGLFSIRERVQLLGGRMKIKSIKGKGSTFFIAVPDSPKEIVGVGPRAYPLADGDKAKEGGQGGPPLRVLVADDHEVVRQGLAALLREEPDIEVVGEAANGREAVDMASRLHPDVVIMDVAMPLMNGDEATRQTKLHLPGIRVIALSMYAEDGMIEKMQRAGAECYILKTAPAGELLATIRGKKACA